MAVPSDLGLEELDYTDAITVKIHFHLSEIIRSNFVRSNLYSLYELSLKHDYEFRLMSFFTYHGWDELDHIGEN